MSMINTCLHKIYFINESETENSSLPNSYNGKKVSNTFPTKMFIEESPLIQRKFSLEPFNNFAPQIKPLEIRLTPSKLRLNTKGFKDLKVNQENQILLQLTVLIQGLLLLKSSHFDKHIDWPVRLFHSQLQD